jgi:hypothetical protein
MWTPPCKSGNDCAEGHRCERGECKPSKKVGNYAPIARTGAHQRVIQGSTVQLDGSLSTDANFDYLLYHWSFEQKPDGSRAELQDPDAAKTSFIADQYGLFSLRLHVRDGMGDSEDIVHIRVNRPPIARTVDNIIAIIGDKVKLDASESEDPDGDSLKYLWKIMVKPPQSETSIEQISEKNTFLIVDQSGFYDIELTVRDGLQSNTAKLRILAIDREDLNSNLLEIKPAKVPINSLVDITLRGENFIQGSILVLGDQREIPLRYESTTLAFTTIDLRRATEEQTGLFKARIRSPKGKTTNALEFEIVSQAVPEITKIDPQMLIINNGNVLDIKGRNFVRHTKLLLANKKYDIDYINFSQIKVRIELSGDIKVGNHEIYLENSLEHKSKPTEIRVINQPNIPSILYHEISPQREQIYNNRHYNSLKLFGHGFRTDTKLLLNQRAYSQNYTLQRDQNGAYFIEIQPFSTVNWPTGKIALSVQHELDGILVTSHEYHIQIHDHNVPIIDYISFSDSLLHINYTGSNEFIYPQVYIRGNNFYNGIQVELGGKLYTGAYDRMDTNTIILWNFDTSGWKPGQHICRVYNIDQNGIYESNHYTFTLEDSRVPAIQSVTTSDGLPPPLAIGHRYNFIRINGKKFLSSAKVFIDGIEYKGRIDISHSRNAIYLYNFSTMDAEAKNYKFFVKNYINDAPYISNTILIRYK